MSRWKVHREHGMFWNEDSEVRYGPRWHVTSPTGLSWGNYKTHAEAMARADKQSRTITVTLPCANTETLIPSRYDFPHEPPLSVRFTERMTWIREYEDGSGGTVILDIDQLEPLALALLAHARRGA